MSYHYSHSFALQCLFTPVHAGTFAADMLVRAAEMEGGRLVLDNITKSFEKLVLRVFVLCVWYGCPVGYNMWCGTTFWLTGVVSVHPDDAGAMSTAARNIDKAIGGIGVKSPAQLTEWLKANKVGTVHSHIQPTNYFDSCVHPPYQSKKGCIGRLVRFAVQNR
jgi:hypothetical protein